MAAFPTAKLDHIQRLRLLPTVFEGKYYHNKNPKNAPRLTGDNLFISLSINIVKILIEILES